MRGYKAMSKDMKCKDVQFEVGKTYSVDKLVMCSSGFHFCENAFDVYEYYPKEADTVICEVEALGQVIKEGTKSATDKIKIVRKLEERELLELWIKRTNSGHSNSGNCNSGNCNSGHCNSGHSNSGNCNSGNCNSGHCNSGHYNSGHSNSGHSNSGDYNSGHCNSGHYNSGHYNSGHSNSGNHNSGDYNSGHSNSGYFNTINQPIFLFNKLTTLEHTQEFRNKMYSLNVKPILQWIQSSSMTEDEKKNYPSHVTTGGFLKNIGKNDWSQLTEENKEFLKSLPGFDDEIFFQITGIKLLEEMVDVIVNGVTKKVSKSKAKEWGLI